MKIKKVHQEFHLFMYHVRHQELIFLQNLKSQKYFIIFILNKFIK